MRKSLFQFYALLAHFVSKITDVLVVLIGDNADFLLSIAQYIAHRASFSIVTSEDMLGTVYSENPKYIFVDFDQRTAFGIGLVEEIRTMYPDTYLCAVTGQSNPGTVQRIQQQAFDKVIAKGPQLVSFLKFIS